MVRHLAKWFAVALALFLALQLVYRAALGSLGAIPSDGLYSAARIGDITVLYALMPAYFVLVGAVLTHKNRDVRAQLESLAPVAWSWTSAPLARWLVPCGVLGWLYGALDYGLDLGNLEGWNRSVSIVFGVGNGLVWMCAGLVMGWRLRAARYFRALGAVVRVDLFNLRALRPFGLVATFDVLAVMGALALVPLQSVSTEFEWAHYRTAFAVGIPAGIVFLVLPMLGARRNIATAKQAALLAAESGVAAADRGDAARLELLLSHRDRIQDTSTWPIDTRLVSRALLYLVVPPLAWVGAAIVERGVEQVF